MASDSGDQLPSKYEIAKPISYPGVRPGFPSKSKTMVPFGSPPE
jgi:hypothetical protein